MSAKPHTVPVKIVGKAQMPVMTDAERRAFLDSLQEAEAQIARGEYTVFEPESFSAWLRASRDTRSDEG